MIALASRSLAGTTMRLAELDHGADAVGLQAQRLALEPPRLVGDLPDGVALGEPPDGLGGFEHRLVADAEHARRRDQVVAVERAGLTALVELLHHRWRLPR